MPPNMRTSKPPNKVSSISPTASICELFLLIFFIMSFILHIYLKQICVWMHFFCKL
jgi:hypothetical protein